jgi:hypothetical protein
VYESLPDLDGRLANGVDAILTCQEHRRKNAVSSFGTEHVDESAPRIFRDIDIDFLLLNVGFATYPRYFVKQLSDKGD